MILSNIIMLLVENNRSRAYLQRMAFHDLLPNHVILLENTSGVATPGQKNSDLKADAAPAFKATASGFQLRENEPLKETLAKLSVPFTALPTVDINSDTVFEALQSRPEQIIVYSGPGGAILKAKLFTLPKNFLHIHPGIVPDYRGSTTIYYSLLNEGKAGASAIFLSPEIDQGPLLAIKEFEPPADRREIDYLYDPLVRSELLVDVLLGYREKGTFETTPQDLHSDPYFIMHPVLRHICILGKP